MSSTNEARITPMFLVLCIVYTTTLILSNIIACKLIQVAGYILPAAVIVYPIVYIISDIMTEVYGMRLSMLAIKMNTAMNFLMVVVFAVASVLPFPAFWANQPAFDAIFGTTFRIVCASLIGYYVGDWANSMTISVMKQWTKGKWFPFRAIASTLVGQVFDIGLFITIAFAWIVPWDVLTGMIVAQYVVKVGYEAVCVPLTTVVVRWWKAHESFEVWDEMDLETYKPF